MSIVTATTPIQVFSVADFNINLPLFLQTFQPLFYSLPLDDYDAKKEQIMLLQNHLPAQTQGPQTTEKLHAYYMGELSLGALQPYLEQLLEEKQTEFAKIKPYRRRAVSRFAMHKNGHDWNFKRIPTKSFSQTEAKIAENYFDIRSLPRVFTEIDEQHVEQPLFHQLLTGLARRVGGYHPEISALDITVHHVLVETFTERVTSNSPEGIHQDGYDYIVSALVMERRNVLGGESQIFDEDKTTKILTTTLQPGHGILQPDKNTHLWHKVSQIVVEDPKKALEAGTLGAFRSSMGFDIALVR